MGRVAIALVLILDVLVCPFACRGAISVGNSAEVADPCCPPKQTGSDGQSPLPADNGRDASCGSCLCGGAVRGEQSQSNYDSAQVHSIDAWLPPLTVESVTSPAFAGSPGQFDHSPRVVSGAALRALLQSLLI